MFESMLNDITSQFLFEVIEHEKLHHHEDNDDIDLNEDHEHGDHEEHIEVTEVKDITNETKPDNTDDVNETGSEEKVREKEEIPVKVEQEEQDENAVMINPLDVDVKHDGDNVMSSKDRKKQIKEERRKNSIFARVTKYFSYALGIIVFVVIFRRLYSRMKLENIEEPKMEKTK
jgi:hypothetical protein